MDYITIANIIEEGAPSEEALEKDGDKIAAWAEEMALAGVESVDPSDFWGY